MNRSKKLLLVTAAAFAAFAGTFTAVASAELTAHNPTPATAAADQIVVAGPCVQGFVLRFDATLAETAYLALPAPQAPAGVIVNDGAAGSSWLPYNVALSAGNFDCPAIVPTNTASTAVTPSTPTTEHVTTTTVHVITTTTLPHITTTTGAPATTTTRYVAPTTTTTPCKDKG